ncbi:hypothetical protein QWJ07_30960 [Frankia sp. RB7]|nr:hypothetical protein [Frankia sp. RB7]
MSPSDDSKSTTVYLRVSQVRQRYGDCSDMWITRKTREAAFPAPVHLGGRDRFWRLEDLESWDRAMIERGAEPTPVPPPRKAVRS